MGFKSQFQSVSWHLFGKSRVSDDIVQFATVFAARDRSGPLRFVFPIY